MASDGSVRPGFPKELLGSKCNNCNRRVLAMEKLEVNGKTFHRGCFKCVTCGLCLSPNTFTAGDDGLFYCMPHGLAKRAKDRTKSQIVRKREINEPATTEKENNEQNDVVCNGINHTKEKDNVEDNIEINDNKEIDGNNTLEDKEQDNKDPNEADSTSQDVGEKEECTETTTNEGKADDVETTNDSTAQLVDKVEENALDENKNDDSTTIENKAQDVVQEEKSENKAEEAKTEESDASKQITEETTDKSQINGMGDDNENSGTSDKEDEQQAEDKIETETKINTTKQQDETDAIPSESPENNTTESVDAKPESISKETADSNDNDNISTEAKENQNKPAEKSETEDQDDQSTGKSEATEVQEDKQNDTTQQESNSNQAVAQDTEESSKKSGEMPGTKKSIAFEDVDVVPREKKGRKKTKRPKSQMVNNNVNLKGSASETAIKRKSVMPKMESSTLVTHKKKKKKNKLLKFNSVSLGQGDWNKDQEKKKKKKKRRKHSVVEGASPRDDKKSKKKRRKKKRSSKSETKSSRSMSVALTTNNSDLSTNDTDISNTAITPKGEQNEIKHNVVDTAVADDTTSTLVVPTQEVPTARKKSIQLEVVDSISPSPPITPLLQPKKPKDNVKPKNDILLSIVNLQEAVPMHPKEDEKEKEEEEKEEKEENEEKAEKEDQQQQQEEEGEEGEEVKGENLDKEIELNKDVPVVKEEEEEEEEEEVDMKSMLDLLQSCPEDNIDGDSTSQVTNTPDPEDEVWALGGASKVDPELFNYPELLLLQQKLRKGELVSDARSDSGRTKIEVAAIGLVSVNLFKTLESLTTYYAAQLQINFLFCPDYVTPAASSKLNSFKEKGARIVESFEDATNDNSISWVINDIATNSKYEYTAQALSNNRNVFCNVPIASSIEQCIKLQQDVQNSNSIFYVGNVLRHLPVYEKIKSLLTSNKIGKIMSVEANGHQLLSPLSSSSYFLDTCCEEIATLNWLLDSIPVSVASFGCTAVEANSNESENENVNNNNNANSDDGGDDDDDDDKTEQPDCNDNSADGLVDNQVVILSYRNKANVTFHANSHHTLDSKSLTICGTAGSLFADIKKGEIKYRKKSTGVNGDVPPLFVKPSLLHRVIAKEMTNVLVDKNVSSNLNDALVSTITCLAIEEARTNCNVIHLPSIWDQLSL